MKINTWVGNCCGVAELSGLSCHYNESNENRCLRIIKDMYNFIEKDGSNLSNYHSDKNERLSCYVLCDRESARNAKRICEFFVLNNLGTYQESPILDNTYNSHMFQGKSNSRIQVFLLYPNWNNIENFIK